MRPPKGTQPEYRHDSYKSTLLRAPSQPLIELPDEPGNSLYNPIGEPDNDLTRQCTGEPQGERIIVGGRVLEEDGQPVPNAVVELWQANAAGRYLHALDQHPAPLDPNFIGAGRAITDSVGRYRFTTIKPGAYPWRNHPNAWRPAHLHFSLFGSSFVSRLVTQMFFPGDPLLELDPILDSVRDPDARRRLVSSFDLDITEPEWALGYRFDIVLRGRYGTPFERAPTASQTVGPFFNFALTANKALGQLARDGIRLSLRILDGEGKPASGDAMVELWQDGAFGRLETGPDGVCVFETVKAPCITVAIFGRGLLKQLMTRVYFEADEVPAFVQADRRYTLVATPTGPDAWHLDIRLQGNGETVFFDV